MAQYLCRYRKGEQVRWISHLDLKRTLERAMRRAELPLELSKGHNPHPKLSFGPPLSLGATGDAELLAFHLEQAMDPAEIKHRLTGQLPAGLEVIEVWALPPHRKKETLGEVDVADYRITVAGEVEIEQVRAGVRKLLACEELIVERGGERPERTVDLRPLIKSLEVVGSKVGEVELRARLRTGSHGGARAQEIIALLGLDEGENLVRYHRIGLYAEAEARAGTTKGVWRRWKRSRSQQGRS